jgi:signal transduction histidine kinase
MNRVEKFRKHLKIILVLSFSIVVLLGAFMLWLLTNVFGINALVSLLIAAGLSVVVGWIVAITLENTISKPISLIYQAAAHVGTGPSQDPAPTIPPSIFGSELAQTLAEQIYALASMSKDLTADIEGQRSFLSTAINTLPVGVFIFDKKQQLHFINQTGVNLLKHSPEELIGLPLVKTLDWLFKTDETYDVWLDQVRKKAVKADKFWEHVSLSLTDGNRKTGDVIAHYEKHPDFDVETIVTFVDRTQDYAADEAEMDFVAVAAHELRGPITVIRGYLDVFKEEVADKFTVDQQLLLQKMTVSAEMLSLYINNILNVARIDQQSMKLHIVEADWLETVKEAYADLFLRAKARGRLLKLDLPKDLPTVGIDRVSITEVINNLVDNAIKYSSEGGEILISVKEVEGLVETTIQDFGIGMPETVVGNLFKKFYRSHRSRQGVSGTGLGLYLSKSIMDAHGGNIWVRSKEGEGSTFGFDLPTYSSIAESLKKGDNDGKNIKRSSHGWIKNHSMYRR